MAELDFVLSLIAAAKFVEVNTFVQDGLCSIGMPEHKNTMVSPTKDQKLTANADVYLGNSEA